MIAHCSNGDITDRRLELDKRVSFVVRIRGASFATGTEICVVANGTLVTISLDIRLTTVGLVTERSITVDAMMASLTAVRSRHGSHITERLVNGDESVTRVDICGIRHARGAEIPVRAVKALVANTIDVLLAVRLCMG